MEDPKTPEAIHETLYDGKDVVVRHRNGQPEAVKVRKIPRDQFAQLALVADGQDEDGECAFYAGRDADWVRSLDDESYDLVLKEGQLLNFPRFSAWCERQARRLDALTSQGALLEKSLNLIERSPALKTALGSMNGSSPRATAKRTSGNGAPTN